MMGVTDDSNLTPEPLRVDPVTGRLLIHIINVTSGSPATSSVARRDGNYVTAEMGVTNDANLTPESLRTNGGYLAIDVA